MGDTKPNAKDARKMRQNAGDGAGYLIPQAKVTFLTPQGQVARQTGTEGVQKEVVERTVYERTLNKSQAEDLVEAQGIPKAMFHDALEAGELHGVKKPSRAGEGYEIPEASVQTFIPSAKKLLALQNSQASGGQSSGGGAGGNGTT